VRRALAALVLVAAAASIPRAAAGRGIELSASPLRVTLRGASSTVITVRNPGGRALRVDVARAGFARSLSGRPRVQRGRRAIAWLRVRPLRLRIAARAKATLHVSARPPRGAAPGDHLALALLTTRPLGVRRVRLRLRVGVIVVLHVRGRIVRRLDPRSLTIRRTGSLRMLELLVVNRGNVTERLSDDRLRLKLLRRGRVFATLRPRGRELLPRSVGIAEFAYRGRVRGDVLAQVAVRPEVHGPRRSFRVRL
jgi:hypothetical protein